MKALLFLLSSIIALTIIGLGFNQANAQTRNVTEILQDPEFDLCRDMGGQPLLSIQQ